MAVRDSLVSRVAPTQPKPAPPEEAGNPRYQRPRPPGRLWALLWSPVPLEAALGKILTGAPQSPLKLVPRVIRE